LSRNCASSVQISTGPSKTTNPGGQLESWPPYPAVARSHLNVSYYKHFVPWRMAYTLKVELARRISTVGVIVELAELDLLLYNELL